MSAKHCPVCNEPKEKKWHLVCPYCWVKVPDADKDEVYHLYAKARGSEAHAIKCRQVVRALYVAQLAVAGDLANAKSEGSTAFHNAQPDTANPYTHGTDKHRAWNDGFMESYEAGFVGRS